ncbi:hypothetical protein WN48_04255 [Eufriesea mexicana]|uniref:Uncharacterized protein n=1 Tax=Eufriesea mexicana TaxID=516756 RepID=A0A310SNS6_9HYME|nr:hypothetical protein WN48_04255 [Eufriesea mexicana]
MRTDIEQRLGTYYRTQSSEKNERKIQDCDISILGMIDEIQIHIGNVTCSRFVQRTKMWHTNGKECVTSIINRAAVIRTRGKSGGDVILRREECFRKTTKMWDTNGKECVTSIINRAAVIRTRGKSGGDVILRREECFRKTSKMWDTSGEQCVPSIINRAAVIKKRGKSGGEGSKQIYRPEGIDDNQPVEIDLQEHRGSLEQDRDKRCCGDTERRTSFQRDNRSGRVPNGFNAIDSLSHGSCSANGIIADIQFTALC